MKILWIALLVLCPAAAFAASPEQSYLAARDAQIRKVTAASKAGVESERFTKAHERALADLESKLKQLIGPSALTVPGIGKAPKANYDALLEGDQGFGMLDGLVYASEDYKSRVVVTTEALFKNWLRDHRKWWNANNVPQDPAKALADPSFYTQAVNADAALSKYAELPIRKPAAASVAYAMLGGWAQDDGPWQADELVISVVQGGKLYVVRVPAVAKLGPYKPCQTVWEAAERKANAAFQKGGKSVDAGSKTREEGAAAFRRCVAERAVKDKGFPELVRQAQIIVDGLPVK